MMPLRMLNATLHCAFQGSLGLDSFRFQHTTSKKKAPKAPWSFYRWMKRPINDADIADHGAMTSDRDGDAG
ncbi:hypothetical protein DWV00_12380 [Trinickia dinghuensis]|uniref:Uncharacterized protein n=1 Tax=Trinickia dinghuensis TaxID=2291023 RepID=A0A3D8K0R5_9BURK|nr:hypothetical protein DWV00_12380 [Trinickia dinghuensis]